jgi:hypothetical protein
MLEIWTDIIKMSYAHIAIICKDSSNTFRMDIFSERLYMI